MPGPPGAAVPGWTLGVSRLGQRPVRRLLLQAEASPQVLGVRLPHCVVTDVTASEAGPFKS